MYASRHDTNSICLEPQSRVASCVLAHDPFTERRHQLGSYSYGYAPKCVHMACEVSYEAEIKSQGH